MEYGIPSHDNFGDVFAVIYSEEFSECFFKWVSDLADLTTSEVIVIDGKI